MSKFGEFPFTRCQKPRRGYANSKTWIPDAHIVQAGHEPFTESNAGGAIRSHASATRARTRKRYS